MKFKTTVASDVYGIPLTDSRGKMVKRPLLEVALVDVSGDSVFEGVALIDSGADTTMLNIQYAPILGIDLTNAKNKNVRGIGSGSVPTKESSARFKFTRLGDEVELPVWFVDSGNVNILLGREVFFEQYRIKFEIDHDTFEVTKAKK